MVYTDGTHLVADCLEELHWFAQKRLGLKAEWFQGGLTGQRGRPAHPHYDLTSIAMFQRALDAGAIKVGVREVVAIERRLANQQRNRIRYDWKPPTKEQL